MLTFYSVIVLEVIFLMLLLGIMASTNDLFSQQKRRLFLLVSFTVILAIIAEWSGSMTTIYGGKYRLFHVWTKVAELSLTPVLPFLCAEILNQSVRTPKKALWIHGILLFHTGLEILSAFGEFIFYVDADGIFRHGPFYWIYLATYLGGAVYVLWTGHKVSSQYQNKNRIVLSLILAFLLFGIAANQFDKSIKSAWLTVAIDVTMIYIFYNDMIQRVDEMTMLLNRTSYDNHLPRLREPVIIQFFDVDLFKSVNDEYGHLYGDHCLQMIGRIIRSTYEKVGRCYRIGGDEFCVIFNSDNVAVADLNSRFFAAMQKQRDTDAHFPYVSVGHARYNPASEKIEDAIQTADSVMYHYKERNKIKYGPITLPSLHDNRPPINQVLTESQEPPADGALDTSGLTDRIFAAFSGTSKRNYYYICNMTTMVSRWSPAAVQYFGLPGEYMLNAGIIWESYIHPQDRTMYHENIEAVFSGKSPVHELEYRVKNRLGEYVVCTCRGVVLKGNDTEPDLFAGTIINHGIIDDVDPITNLHNNSEFTKSVHRLIEERTPACIIKLGIDHFRHVNAMYGQQGGNQVLRLFGIELRDLIEGQGQAFRLDGAKFAFYLYHANQEQACELYRRLREIAETNIRINNFRIPLKLYGGAVLLDNRHPYNDYIVRSGLIYAMDQSRDINRGDLTFVEDIHQTVDFKNIKLHTDIHSSAMDGCRNFFLCYQPIVSFATGKIVGAEVLLRWKKEPYGVVPPDQFIPWLENDPAFIQVGNWILRQAIEETRSLRQADPAFLLNVNIAMPQLEHDNFREDVLNIMDETGCPPQNICLELTERCRHLDLDFLSDELKHFRSHGFTVAIDDFGTGFSSLTLLLKLPIDVLKVDRFFLTDIFMDSSHRRLMEHILEYSRQSGYRTCIEGIETKEEYDLISSISGDCYQGYYCCKPVPIKEFLEFYRQKQNT